MCSQQHQDLENSFREVFEQSGLYPAKEVLAEAAAKYEIAEDKYQSLYTAWLFEDFLKKSFKELETKLKPLKGKTKRFKYESLSLEESGRLGIPLEDYRRLYELAKETNSPLDALGFRLSELWEWFAGKDKRLWDVLQLAGVIAIPVVLAVATTYFTIEKNRQDVLEKYFDSIENLQTKTSQDVEQKAALRVAAKARTLVALKGLQGVPVFGFEDRDRVERLLSFLKESGLIARKEPDSTSAPLMSPTSTSTGQSSVSPAVEAQNSATNPQINSMNFEGVHLGIRNLKGINLSGTDLSGINLSGTILVDADLAGADLSNADLRNTDLSRAILVNARLESAKLQGAKLKGANLRGAKLTNANLKDARDTEAVEDAIVCNTTMPDGKVSDCYNPVNYYFDSKNFTYVVTRDTNIRSGPGVDYPTLGTQVLKGEKLTITDQVSQRNGQIWRQLDNGGWVRANDLE